MRIYKSLTHLANGINAANRINEIKKLHGNMSNKETRTSNLIEMLKAISEHAPEYHRNVLERTIEMSNRYHSAYKNIKEYYGTNAEIKNKNGDFLTTLKIIKPVFGINNPTIDKLLKVYEIMNSLE